MGLPGRGAARQRAVLQHEPFLHLRAGNDHPQLRNTKLEGQREQLYILLRFLPSGAISIIFNGFNSLSFEHIQVQTKRPKPRYKANSKGL